MEQLFEEFLLLSERLRPSYIASLGKATRLPVINASDYPTLLTVIYKNVAGTKRKIKDQRYMDFIPGYYLIHIDEYQESLETQTEIVEEFSDKKLVPFLRNYSSDFISIEIGTNHIYYVYHDNNEIYKAYETETDFLKTIIAFYRQKVYFLDNDSYLDYDEDAEYVVAHQLNPTIDFWID